MRNLLMSEMKSYDWVHRLAYSIQRLLFFSSNLLDLITKLDALLQIPHLRATYEKSNTRSNAKLAKVNKRWAEE